MNHEVFTHLLSKSRYGSQDTDRHLLTLFSLVVGTGAKRIMELGVRTGNTTLPFICAAMQTGGMVESIDCDPTDFVCPNDAKMYWKFYQRDALEWLESKVQEKQRYDIIYVDDWHAYDHVKKELELIDKLVDSNSIVLLHDLMYSNAQPDYRSVMDPADDQWAKGGPYRAVSELDTDIWEWATIPANHGLTILRKKGQVLTQ